VSAAARLAIARHEAEHLLDRVLRVFEKAVLAIPPDRLDFRATPAAMSAAELGYHVYQVVYIMTRAAETGAFRAEQLAEIPFDETRITHPEQIVAYGREVTRYARAAVAGFTEMHVDRVVENALGPRVSGLACVTMALEEAVHHRGQLHTYLRLMGVVPPRLYDYS
jgi:uncharacterized damage-inducible protein DinB